MKRKYFVFGEKDRKEMITDSIIIKKEIENFDWFISEYNKNPELFLFYENRHLFEKNLYYFQS